MNYEIKNIINSNILLKKYLRENSFYYKNLIRNPLFINTLIEFMKRDYKLTVSDKLEKINNDLNIMSSVIDILK